MATKIKETPVLSKKQWDRWWSQVKANENNSVPKEDYARAMATYEQVMKASKLG